MKREYQTKGQRLGYKLNSDSPEHSRKQTKRRLKGVMKMAEYERIAEERGVPVARVIAEDIA